MNDYDVMDKVMWQTYENARKSGYKMDGLEDYKRIAILEDFLLPYFSQYQEYKICAELKNQIDLIKGK